MSETNSALKGVSLLQVGSKLCPLFLIALFLFMAHICCLPLDTQILQLDVDEVLLCLKLSVNTYSPHCRRLVDACRGPCHVDEPMHI